jgi:two-component system OmpR family sensor kinase
MSLRTRLLVAVGTVALVALLVADFLTYSALGSFLITQVDRNLDSAATRLGQTLDRGIALGFRAVEQRAPGMFVETVSPSGQVISSIKAIGPGGVGIIPKLSSSELAAAANAGATPYFFTAPSQGAGGPQLRMAAVGLFNGAELLVGKPLTAESATLHRLLVVEVAVTLAALIAGAGLGWWLVRLGLTPLSRIEQTAQAVAAGELERDIPGSDERTEVGRLAATLNVMLGRIREAFNERDRTEAELRRSEEQLRRFVADASHELRTPLAAVSAYAELFERASREHPQDLERILGGIKGEAARMTVLVNDLLLLARLDEGRPLAKEPVELTGLTAEAVRAAQAVGSAWPLSFEASEPIEVIGDRDRLRQVVDNLLSNVRSHTPEGTAATVRVFRENGAQAYAVIEVADEGPGMSEEDAKRVFERFFRADTSRSRQHGGSGLGLAIVAAIVASHGGNARVYSRPGGGAIFQVRIPVLTNASASERTTTV